MKNIVNSMENNIKVYSIKSLDIFNASKIYYIWVDHINLNSFFNSSKIAIKKNTLIVIGQGENFEGISNYNSNFYVIEFREKATGIEKIIYSSVMLKNVEKLFIIQVDSKGAKNIGLSFMKALHCKCLKNRLNNALLLNDVNEAVVNSFKSSWYQLHELAFVFNKLIVANYKSEHLVAGYAAKLNIQPKLLLRYMLNLGLKKPSITIKEKIVLEAKRMLVYSNRSIIDICFELGFDDPAYFARIFKKNVGVTASNYRMMHVGLENCEKCTTI